MDALAVGDHGLFELVNCAPEHLGVFSHGRLQVADVLQNMYRTLYVLLIISPRINFNHFLIFFLLFFSQEIVSN